MFLRALKNSKSIKTLLRSIINENPNNKNVCMEGRQPDLNDTEYRCIKNQVVKI